MGGISGRKRNPRIPVNSANVSKRSQALFLHEPRTEQEVVCLFGALLADLGLVIERVQTPFPDCIVRRKNDNKKLRVEFELYGSHFVKHRHPLRGCDMLVCWVDDYGSWRNKPDDFVVELADVVKSVRPELIATMDDHRKGPWNMNDFLKRAREEQTSTQDIKLAKRIATFARTQKLGPHWLINASAVFAVGDEKQYFKVHSTGRIGFPFSRLKAGQLFSGLRTRLNAAVPSLKIKPADTLSKSKGGQLSELFNTDAQLDEFLEIWTWYRAAAQPRESLAESE